MKKLKLVFGLLAVGMFSFSFTTKNELSVDTLYSARLDVPKVVILDIVDNIGSQGTNIVTELKSKLETLNKEKVNIFIWKDLTKGLQEEEKKSIIDSLKPELIMTLNFDSSDDNTNKVAAVVSKQNVAFKATYKMASELAESLSSGAIKNDGVYQTDSKYIQDNVAPSVFLSLKVKNDPASNVEIINKISNFIEAVQTGNPMINTVQKTVQSDASVQ